MATIIYTHTDEAPLLATYSFLPIVQAYAATGRRRRSRPATSPWPAASSPSSPTGSPTSSASTTPSPSSASWPRRPRPTSSSCPTSPPRSRSSRPRSPSCRSKGYDLPDYPETRRPTRTRTIRARYDKVKGSAVNPVLREGNSDRRAPASVKNYAQATRTDGRLVRRLEDQRRARWASDDFRSNEKSVVLDADDTLRIEHVAADGTTTVLKESVPVLAGEIVDATVHERRRAARVPRRRRSPGPRPTTCCSRCTSRPR